MQTVRSVPVEESIAFNQGPYMQATLRRMETRLGLESMFLDYGTMNEVPCFSIHKKYLCTVSFIKIILFICADKAALIYEACRVDYMVEYGAAPWCAALTNDDLLVFEYSRDINYYWRTSYPYTITSEQACPLIADMTNNFQ